MRESFAPHSCQHLILSELCILAILVGMWCYLFMILICISLMANDVDDLCKCLFTLAQKVPVLCLMLCCCHLEILLIWTRVPHFHFAVGPAKYVASLACAVSRQPATKAATELGHLCMLLAVLANRLGHLFWLQKKNPYDAPTFRSSLDKQSIRSCWVDPTLTILYYPSLFL